MPGDPYPTQSMKTDAGQSDLQKAHRRLAKKHHPDLNRGNPTAEEKFKGITAAYDLLSDPEKRAKFDRGEVDASSHTTSSGFADFGDFTSSADILSELFGRSTRARRRGQDVRYHVELSFLDAINGGKQSPILPDGSTLDVNIPLGTRDGQALRLRGKGRPAAGAGPPRDAPAEISVLPHPYFTRKGNDIHLDLPIWLNEAVLGGKIAVPTPSGTVTTTVPGWSNTGPRAGDGYVRLKIMPPKKPDRQLERFIAQWQPAEQSPRRSMGV